LLAPQICMLVAIAISGFHGYVLWVVSLAAMALLLWSALGWYRQFAPRHLAPAPG
jgi:hypothetical protein